MLDCPLNCAENCRIHAETQRDMSEDVFQLMGYDKENKKVKTVKVLEEPGLFYIVLIDSTPPPLSPLLETASKEERL